MNERESLEREIRDLISLEGIDSTTFSNRLYQPVTGLFTRLGTTKEERDAIVQSDLWKAARRRLRELEQADLMRFRKAAGAVQAHYPNGGYSLQPTNSDSRVP